MAGTKVDIKPGRIGARDLHKQIGQRMIDEASSRKITLSQLLEELDPSTSKDEYDAFERQLEVSEIITETDRAAGYYADKFEAFEKNESTRVLQAEWIDRQFRSVGQMSRREYQRFISSDLTGVDPTLRPVYQAAGNDQFVPQVPLSEIVAFTTTINDNVYRAMYVTGEEEQLGRARVGEGAPIPTARISLGARAIDLFKFGRALVVTYEALRRSPIDTVAQYIRMAALQVEIDKVNEAVRVLLEGDGNPGTAATVINLTTLDEDATAGTLTLRGWMKFKMSYTQPYVLTTELLREDTWLDQYFLDLGENATLGQMPGGLGGFTPINGNMGNDVRVGTLQAVPADRILGFDNRFALQRVVEAGSNISESMRWIRNQTQELTFSENEGFAVVQPQAVKVLNVAA